MRSLFEGGNSFGNEQCGLVYSQDIACPRGYGVLCPRFDFDLWHIDNLSTVVAELADNVWFCFVIGSAVAVDHSRHLRP
jgi:hypothetical protein